MPSAAKQIKHDAEFLGVRTEFLGEEIHSVSPGVLIRRSLAARNARHRHRIRGLNQYYSAKLRTNPEKRRVVLDAFRSAAMKPGAPVPAIVNTADMQPIAAPAERSLPGCSHCVPPRAFNISMMGANRGRYQSH